MSKSREMGLVEFLAVRRAFQAPSVARRFVNVGKVLINGNPVSTSYILQHGDRIEVIYNAQHRLAFDYLVNDDS